MKALDAIKHEDEKGEYWLARELRKALGYSSWQRFETLLKKAKAACAESGADIADHFNARVKMVGIGSKAKRGQEDFELTRFACFLIAQNGDPNQRWQIAAAQAYFALQTLRAEHLERVLALAEKREQETLRVEVRDLLRAQNKLLAQTAAEHGVRDFPRFMGSGLRELYGMTKEQMLEYRKLDGGDHLSRAGHEELALNYLKGTQTDAKIRRENLKTQKQCDTAHAQMAKAIREFVKSQGGTLPEDIPLEEEDVDKVRRRLEAEKKLALKKAS